ncbi:MAG TPA: type I glutamate--ammonia ligase [Candidatus Mcinerneyibacterium sp.]|nr:type I glutamate--ammonia ligase [Candidatus Mcinerneyibacterium sp.]
MKYEEVKKIINKKNIEFIDLKYTDLLGKMRHLTLPVERFDKKLLEDGEAFDASSTSGMKSVASGDMVIIPDLDTGKVDPFWKKPTLSFFCRIADAETKEYFHLDPRGVAERAYEYLKELNIADESLFAPEYEFYLFNELRYSNSDNSAFYSVDTEEVNWNNSLKLEDFDKKGSIKIESGDGYHANPPLDLYYELRNQMVSIIEKNGYGVRYHHHEVAGASQHEIEVLPQNITVAGDMTQLIKYVVKMVSKQNGLIATFMPKPLYNRAGNGMHFHQLLKKDGENVFYKKGEYADLSETALYYIGGILKHGKALTALLNPSTNSFKRLVPGFEAPTAMVYSKGNRSAAIRIPKNFTSEENKRLEYRTGDPTCNVYLAISALLMAGIDGIENRIDPRANDMGPVDINMDELSRDKLKKITHAPSNLSDALDELEKDNEFLLKNNVFSEELINNYIEKKRNELKSIHNRPHPYEVELYFNC